MLLRLLLLLLLLLLWSPSSFFFSRWGLQHFLDLGWKHRPRHGQPCLFDSFLGSKFRSCQVGVLTKLICEYIFCCVNKNDPRYLYIYIYLIDYNCIFCIFCILDLHVVYLDLVTISLLGAPQTPFILSQTSSDSVTGSVEPSHRCLLASMTIAENQPWFLFWNVMGT